VIADLLERLRALVSRARWHRDLDEEMRFHLEQAAAVRIGEGVDPAAALRQARLAFGGVDRYQEETLDASGVRPLLDLAADTRFALRALRRNPGFTVTVVLVLALAIGAATAVFSVVNAVLIADLPYPHPDRLVRVFQQNSPTNRWTLSVVDYQAIRDQQRSFDAFGAAAWGVAALAGAGQPEQIQIVRVTSGFFGALGTSAVAGRLIEPGDELPGAPPVVVVSSAFAGQRLGGAAAAVNRTITLDGVSHAVIGVLAPGVEDLAGMNAVAWPALQPPTPTRRGPFGLRGIGRLKAGVTLHAATRDLAGISRRIFPIWEAGFKDRVARLTPYPLRDTIVGNASQQLRLFAGAVVLVLLVAIANIATLMLVRASARGHELAVRATLGASRARLARLVVTESLVLTALSAAVGLGLAALGLQLVGLIAPNLPRIREIGLDGRAVQVALALGLASGLLVSLSPVAAVLGGGLASLRADSRRSGGGRWSNAVRGGLVAAEFALAVPLLLAAALLLKSFVRLQQVDPGYDAASSFSVWLALPAPRYPDSVDVQGFWQRAVQRALETPGVVAAGLATSPPPDVQGNVNNFNLVAHAVPSGGAEPTSPWSSVTQGYFAALAIPLLDGRVFTEADSLSAPPVAIVSRSWARHYFPGENAIGQQLVGGGCYECPLTTIVGIVGDVKYQGLAGDGDGMYAPLSQSTLRTAALVVRTRTSPGSFIRPVLRNLRGLDPELPLTGQTMSDGLRRALADPRRWTAVLSAFAAVALGLAAMGIFGLMSYVVRRQRREIGVRMALGAEPRAVTGMIVSRGMRYVLKGALAGLGLAVLEGRWLGSLLYGVTPRDLSTFAVVTAVLLVSALLACLLPAIRAARIRPIEALAEE
jgi:putative ABC transport system permease protein